VPNNSDFTIYNIPFGTCSIENGPTFAATIIGDTVISLTHLEKLGLLEGPLFKGKDTF
jgi:fumarylacetoacetase